MENIGNVDTLITGGFVVAMNQARDVWENGAVAVQGSKIAWVGPAGEADFKAKRVIQASGKIVIPGLINAHAHLAMTLFRGLVDDLPLEPWLERVWQVEYDYADAANTYLGTQLALVEMIQGGVTCATDMYWHMFENTLAAEEAGFRLLNGPPITRFTHPVGKRHGSTIEEAYEFLDRYRDHALIHPCVQVHATYTTPEDMLDLAREISEENMLVFVTHASESKAEVETVLGQTGKSPIGYLHSKDLLGPRALLAHCVHLDDEEIALLAELGVSVAHCPESNLKLGNGVARVADMLKAGVNVAIGTDGAATNNDLDVIGEMQTAALIHKGWNYDPTALPADDAFALATVNGARAFGLADRIGSLEKGKLADITIIDLGAANLTPMYNVYSHLVYAVDKNDVQTVFIHGKLVMEDRELITLDEEEIKSRARAVGLRIQNSVQKPG
jgi:5-methylthioadenosine/S-adenosylhomocysteine deaminase